MAEKLEIIIQAKDKFSKSFGRLQSAMPSLRRAAIGATAAIAGLGGALAVIVKTTANSYDQIAKLGTQLGVTTEFLSSMQHAADLSGIRIGTLNKSVAMLQVRIGEAGRGIGEAKNAFESLGIQIHDTSGQLLTAEQIMPQLADAFHNMENATMRAEAASKIFGQRGMAMIQMFKNGSAGLAEMTAEAEKFGLVVSQEAAANAEEFNDSLTRVTGAFKGIKNAIAEQFFPELAKSSNKMADWIAQNREMIAIKTAEWFRNVADMMIAVGNAFKWIDDNITDKILQFFFGPTETPSKIELLNKQIEIARQNIHDYYVALADGEQPEESFLQLQIDKIRILEQEIEALTNVKERQAVLTASTNQLAAATKKSNEALSESVNQYRIIDEVLTAFFSDIDSTTRGQALAQGLFPFNDANVEKTQENMSIIKESFDSYFAEGLESYEAFLGAQRAAEASTNEQSAIDTEDTENKKVAATNRGLNKTLQITKAFGAKGFALTKGIAIAQSTISAYRGFAGTLATASEIYPPPIPHILAGIELAAGLAQVAAIAGTNVPAAHGGLTNVPREQTFLLDRGERIISPQQNKDLTEFLEGANSQALQVENINIEVLPNATNTEGLLSMTKDDWRDIIEEKIIFALKDLQVAGIKI
jgi:hypothetical protein